MRYFVAIALSALTIAGTADRCSGQVFGHFSAAHVVGYDEKSAGAYFTLADDTIGLLSQFRYGVSGAVDFGLQLGFESMDDFVETQGFLRTDGDTHLLLAGDLKYMVRDADDEIPFDLSLDFGVGFRDMKMASSLLFSLGGQTGWRGHEPESRGLEPYLGLELIVDRMTVDLPQGDKTETNNDLEVRIGTAYRVADGASLTAEIHAGDETSFGVGINFAF